MDDLQWQWGDHGGVLPRLVDEILERGGLAALVEAAREREDWFCAEGAVRGLCAAGEFGRAWAVVEPFAATGWQPAVRAGADVLLRWGHTDRALELARPREPQGNAADVWRDYAEVLVGAGRVDDAIGVLDPYKCGGWALGKLVELTEGRGRDERLLELLAPIAEEFRHGPGQCGVRNPWHVLPAQARVLERSGRADEAIRLLGADVAARRDGLRTTIEFYVRLLARHGRIEELRDLATCPELRAAPGPYVTALEDLGRAAEAEAYLRDLIAARQPGWHENALMELLVRQGRFDDAIGAVEHTFDDLYDGNLLHSAMLLLAEQGRHDKALELTEGRSPEFLAENEAFWLRSDRWWLMGEAGRAREAIAEIEALPADEVDDRETTIAWLLARDGRVEEAVALLRPLPGKRAATDLAELLVRQGRFTEAIGVIPGVAAQREEERRFWTDWRKRRKAAAGDDRGGGETPPF
ncbi:tetratricopeptide repeat protein [Streptomyces sp. FH025]|uniref:tetratricopeptide repeat protein n=1 Tax=Streptomyces sp. FH025 TaxID=2815937 RepID=UPI001A9EF8D4|nr:tetratricopeptide repeat protein [Streptomyces sp. FH025]MBO1416205.1 tetratricopeptide repeat protein [Streptomyces sp. FH025]